MKKIFLLLAFFTTLVFGKTELYGFRYWQGDERVRLVFEFGSKPSYSYFSLKKSLAIYC